MIPRPASPNSEVYLLVKLKETGPFDEISVQIKGSSDHAFLLSPVSPTLWIGKIRIPTALSSDFPVLMTFIKGDLTFYKAYKLDPAKISPYLSEAQSMTDKFGITPNAFTDTLAVPSPTYPRYARDNLLSTPFGDVTGNLSVKGVKTISVRSKFKTGTKEGFREGFTRDELLLLTVKGKVANIDVNATFQDASIKLDDTNKNTISIQNETGELYFGEYQAGLNQTEFSSFSKRLDGIKGIYHAYPYHLTAMVSESKGTPQFDKLYGQNSQGPYTLSQKPVIIYSETVTYAGKVLARDTDYVMDYELGQITFKTTFITDTELFTVSYEYSNTLFRQLFIALRTDYAPTDNYSQLAFTLLRQSDSGISPTATVSPQTHTQFGIDGRFEPWTGIKLQNETAYSILANASIEDRSGWAIRQGIQFERAQDPVTFSGSVKKLSGGFLPVGNPSLNPGLFGYEFEMLYTPTPTLSTRLQNRNNRYLKNGGDVSNSLFDSKTKFGPLSYSYYQSTDRDLSTSGNYFDRVSVRHQTGISATYGWLQIEPGYKIERNRDIYNAGYESVNTAYLLNTSLVGIENTQLAANIELQSLDKPMTGKSTRNTYAVSAAIEPVRNYSLDGTAKLVDDSQYGASALSTLGYNFRPVKSVKLNGSYNLETVLETLNTTKYRVMKHQANFGFSFLPIQGLDMGYKLKPAFSEIKALDNLRYEDRLVNQYTVGIDLIDNLTMATDLKTTDRTTLDKTKFPDAITTRKTKETVLLVQNDYRISDQSTLKYTYESEQNLSDDLQSSVLPTTYDHADALTKRQSIEYLSGLTDTLKAGLTYRHENQTVSRQLTPDSNTATLTQTIDATAEWRLSPRLTTKFSGAGSKTIDHLGLQPDTYFLTPRIEARYRPSQEWNLTGFFELSHSFAGQTIRRKKASLALKYDTAFSDSFTTTLTAQLDYEGETAPGYFETWDILTKLTVIF